MATQSVFGSADLEVREPGHRTGISQHHHQSHRGDLLPREFDEEFEVREFSDELEERGYRGRKTGSRKRRGRARETSSSQGERGRDAKDVGAAVQPSTPTIAEAREFDEDLELVQRAPCGRRRGGSRMRSRRGGRGKKSAPAAPVDPAATETREFDEVQDIVERGMKSGRSKSLGKFGGKLRGARGGKRIGKFGGKRGGRRGGKRGGKRRGGKRAGKRGAGKRRLSKQAPEPTTPETPSPEAAPAAAAPEAAAEA